MCFAWPENIVFLLLLIPRAVVLGMERQEAASLFNGFCGAMRALGRGLETHRSSRRGRELLEAQEDWAGAAVPALGEGLATLRREEAKVPPSRDSLNGYARWQFRLRVAGLMTLCGEHLQTAVGLRPEEAVSHREDLDLFSALRAVIFLRQAFLVSRHLLVGSLGSLLLLLFGRLAIPQ